MVSAEFATISQYSGKKHCFWRTVLLNAQSVRGFNMEKNVLRRELVNENLERERRKQEWKKLNVIAREKFFEERIKAQKES